MKKLRHALAAGIATVALIGSAVVTAPAAQAQMIGDGVTAPTHDTTLAVIPLCSPLSALRWLNANFRDHGRDIAHYRVTLRTPFDVIEYAYADGAFHLPATVRTLGGFTQFRTYCTLSYSPR